MLDLSSMAEVTSPSHFSSLSRNHALLTGTCCGDETLVQPFRGLCGLSETIVHLIAPLYDVLTVSINLMTLFQKMKNLSKKERLQGIVLEILKSKAN